MAHKVIRAIRIAVAVLGLSTPAVTAETLTFSYLSDAIAGQNGVSCAALTHCGDRVALEFSLDTASLAGGVAGTHVWTSGVGPATLSGLSLSLLRGGSPIVEDLTAHVFAPRIGSNLSLTLASDATLTEVQFYAVSDRPDVSIFDGLLMLRYLDDQTLTAQGIWSMGSDPQALRVAETSPVPLPAGVILMLSGLAATFGLRVLRRTEAATA